MARLCAEGSWNSLRPYIDEFFKSLDVGQSSKYAYKRQLRAFEKWSASKKDTIFKKEHIIAYKQSLMANGNLSARSIDNYLASVRIFFQWLAEEGIYPNIARGIKGLRRRKGFNKDILTIDQVRLLLGSIDRTTKSGNRDYVILCLMLYTGLRCIEIIRLDITDLSMQGQHMILMVHGKGSYEKDDFVVIPMIIAQLIQQYMGTKIVGKKDPLFTSHSTKNDGQRLTTRSVSRIVKERMRAINLNTSRLTAHSLRHTAITLSLLGGATLQEACAMARHQNINTTLIYAQNLDRVGNAAEYKVEKYLERAMQLLSG